jgi:hypothetical protein
MKRLALLFFVALAALAWGQEVYSAFLNIPGNAPVSRRDEVR